MRGVTAFRASILLALICSAFAPGRAQTPIDLDPDGVWQERIAALNLALDAAPESARHFQARGEAHFYLGNIERSIDDFDRVIELIPYQEPRHWQRGICYYYSGEYAKGVAQFELHQTVNSQDVENSVWHFLCKSRLVGVSAARESLIPISRDYRVPMAEIWELFAGRGSPESVLTAAEGGQGKQSLCYAHLYLGLYFESNDQPQAAIKHIRLAATDYFVDNYMGRVARTHLWLLEAKSSQ